jgi:hypothetical protein
VTHQDHAYALYSELTDGGFNYYLYDYDTGENLPVFQWLPGVDLLESLLNLQLQPVWAYDGEKFAIFVDRPYGIDIAMNIDIDTAVQEKSYDEIMKKYSIPDQFTPISVLGFVPDKDMVVFQSLDPHHVSPNWLFILDFLATGQF